MSCVVAGCCRSAALTALHAGVFQRPWIKPSNLTTRLLLMLPLLLLLLLLLLLQPRVPAGALPQSRTGGAGHR
jgi:hypothetical protein